MTHVLTDGPGRQYTAPAHRPRPRPRTTTVTDGPLGELATLAHLSDLARRSSPGLMHRAILEGNAPADVATAAGLSVGQAHIRWNEWAGAYRGPGVPLVEYLRVHTAFAEALGSGTGDQDVA